MPHDEKKQLNESGSSQPKKLLFQPETLMKVKSIASHVGLLVTLMIYTLIGGLVRYFWTEGFSMYSLIRIDVVFFNLRSDIDMEFKIVISGEIYARETYYLIFNVYYCNFFIKFSGFVGKTHFYLSSGNLKLSGKIKL